MLKFETLLLGAAAIAISTGFGGLAFAAPPADWSAIPPKTVKLFYPGQSSLDWLRSSEHKRAFKKTRQGEACISCHEDEEEEIGATIVGGGRLEPHPVAGKQGSIDLSVQAAHDADNLYLRFQWKTHNPYPGVAHPHWRYDGKD